MSVYGIHCVQTVMMWSHWDCGDSTHACKNHTVERVGRLQHVGRL